MHWITDIVLALRAHDGLATNRQIYTWIRRNRREPLPENWEAAVRACLQRYSATSPQYDSNNPDLFRNVTRGEWRLNSYANTRSVAMLEHDAINAALDSLTDEEIQSLKRDDHLMIKLVELSKRKSETGSPSR